jgi:hypothetical protein
MPCEQVCPLADVRNKRCGPRVSYNVVEDRWTGRATASHPGVLDSQSFCGGSGNSRQRTMFISVEDLRQSDSSSRGDSVCNLGVVHFGLSDLLGDAVADFVSPE